MPRNLYRNLVQTCVLLTILVIVVVNSQEVSYNEINSDTEYSENSENSETELQGGDIVGERTLRLSESPYVLKTDLIVDNGAKLFIEPGVQIRFAPMIGITVRGEITAVVSTRTHFSVPIIFNFSCTLIIQMTEFYHSRRHFVFCATSIL